MTYVEMWSRWAKRLEKSEAGRTGLTVRQARANIARRLQVAPGTWESLVKRRLKAVSHDVAERIRGAIEDDLRQQIDALEHELAIARRGGSALSEHAIGEVERTLEQARRYLAGG